MLPNVRGLLDHGASKDALIPTAPGFAPTHWAQSFCISMERPRMPRTHKDPASPQPPTPSSVSISPFSTTEGRPKNVSNAFRTWDSLHLWVVQASMGGTPSRSLPAMLPSLGYMARAPVLVDSLKDTHRLHWDRPVTPSNSCRHNLP